VKTPPEGIPWSYNARHYEMARALRYHDSEGRSEDAQKILNYLQSNGPESVTRTEISRALFKGGRTHFRMVGALAELLRDGVVRFYLEKRNGRWSQRWAVRDSSRAEGVSSREFAGGSQGECEVTKR
jgi:hypothetical protein